MTEPRATGPEPDEDDDRPEAAPDDAPAVARDEPADEPADAPSVARAAPNAEPTTEPTDEPTEEPAAEPAAEPTDDRGPVEIEGAPVGASCGEHPEKMALVTCPRCGSYCCITCWQGPKGRCYACLLRDPGPPVPWADSERPLPSRFLATLADAFRPRRSADRFARGEWTPALGFAALTFIPLALLSGVVPYTHTLGFGPSFGTILLGEPSPDQAAIALDVLRAAGIGLLVSAARMAILGAAYVSIASAYGTKLPSQPARQAALYRAWLIPLNSAVMSLAAWGMPAEPGELMRLAFGLLTLGPLLLLLYGLVATARQALGIGPIVSLVVVLVPFCAMFGLELYLGPLLAPLMPAVAPAP